MIVRSAAYRPDRSSDLFAPRAQVDGAPVFPPAFAKPFTIDQPPRGRVLIVEDEIPVALDLQKALRDAGYRIVGPAGSQSEVERLVRRGLLDAAVIDADSRAAMPFAVADWLAAEEVPFALIVGEGTEPPREHALRPQLTRPVSPRALVDTVEQMIEGNPAAMPVSAPRWPRLFPQL
ncbi:hypothetical protein [Reyranella sp.]|uniref:hypothetical protein n=1 Tax=Reyranella sp. TaxID=1929291 RepID=UPI003F7151C1